VDLRPLEDDLLMIRRIRPIDAANMSGPCTVYAGASMGKKVTIVTPDAWRHQMTVGGIISAIVVGLIIGALGRLVVPGKQNIPIWLTIVIGIVAALVGTAIARAAGWADTSGVDWIEIVIQVVLAAVGVAAVAGIYSRRSLS
jgi:uncharacterized membrane protein YeaQ/YmgE (transglycosylase-associated protein family)